MADYIKSLRSKIGHDLIFMPASTVIILNDKNEILLQLRKDNNTWAIHGGAIELGEDSINAAIREAKEETGLTVKNLELFAVYEGEDRIHTYPNGDMIQAIDFVYITKDFEGELTPQQEEVLDLKWFSLNELPDNIFRPNIRMIQDIAKKLG